MNTIQKIAVIGAGYMGGGIAQVFAKSGFSVIIADQDYKSSKLALSRLLEEAQNFEEQGLFYQGSAKLIKDNISVASGIEEAVSSVDFVEEAVFEEPNAKRAILEKISKATSPDTIIGTNTSTIPVKTLAPAIKYPERFLTVHFSNPAPFIPGVEIVAGSSTQQNVIDLVKHLLDEVGCKGAQVADAPGMVLNRLQYVLFKEAASIVEEGIATSGEVDTLVKTTFGFRLGFFGPFAIADQAGLDVYANCFKIFEQAYGQRLATPEILSKSIENGYKGLKNGYGITGYFSNSRKRDLISYRNEAYAQMGYLLNKLGKPPKGDI